MSTTRLDDRQVRICDQMPPTYYLHDARHVERVIEWVTFFRRNPSRFVEFYLGIVLHWYQHIILYLMDIYPSVVIVAARSSAKSFLIAAWSCKEAILRPGARIVVASATKKQARLIVSEKISKEIMPRSPLLQKEIAKIKDSQNDIEVVFYNGSSIVVVAANDNARGYRATVLIYEEFRMIAKNIIDSVLSPFLYIRQAAFMQYPEYSDLAETPKEIYISSAWYKNHWMWHSIIKNFTRSMINEDGAMVIAMDYSIALYHKIKDREFLRRERSRMDPTAWAIEYENLMVSENAHAYFTFDLLEKNRVLRRAFYPRNDEDVLTRARVKHPMPKQSGEIRVISCDIATEGGDSNDNSVYALLRLLPESKTYKTTDTGGEHIEIKQGYRRQLVYLEAHNGWETTKQAIRIKQLYADFDADYCVLDLRGPGGGVFDALAKVLYDEERNVEYKPWTTMNEDKTSGRIIIAGQEPVIYGVKASLELNSRIAITMRNSLMSKMFDILINTTEAADEIVKVCPEYSISDVETQLFYESPYLDTVALINEMISLEYTVMPNTGAIRLEEKSTARKDRYTAVSYGNYFADLLEQDLLSDSSEYEYMPLYN